MERIKADIKNNRFSRFYLLTGNEEMLKRQYRDRLVKAMFPEDDDMNLHRANEGSIDPAEIVMIAETLPFFAEQRLICLTDSGWFKKPPKEFLDKLPELPETTYFVFCEKEIDKRNKLYNYIKANGYISEINTPSDDALRKMISQTLKSKGFEISGADADYFLGKVGSDMSRIQCELDKLTAYSLGKDRISTEDIDTICIELPEGKIFQMLDSLMAGDKDKALKLYAELLAAQEKPMNILFMLNRSFNQLYQSAVLSDEGMPRQTILNELGLRDFQLDKYLRIARRFQKKKLLDKIKLGTSLETRVKSGDMDEKIAVEIFVVKS